MSTKTLVEISDRELAKANDRARIRRQRQAEEDLTAATRYFNNFFKLYEHLNPISARNLTAVDPSIGEKRIYFYLTYDGYSFRIAKTDTGGHFLQVQVPSKGQPSHAWINVYSLMDFAPLLRVYGMIE